MQKITCVVVVNKMKLLRAKTQRVVATIITKIVNFVVLQQTIILKTNTIYIYKQFLFYPEG